jgi:rubrerythrin
MTDGQQMRQAERTQSATMMDEPVAVHLGELSAEARQHLDEAARALSELTSDDSQSWLTRARQRGGQ